MSASMNPSLLSSAAPTAQANYSAQDSYFMSLAIEAAKQGLYTTRPNPAVGCVIVKNQQVVGQGFHPQAGQPHAEVFALREAGDDSIGACAYVTLEPCSHTGRTPPCTAALIKAQVARVVVAGLDPNPSVSGRGVAMLKAAGIEVVVGVMKEQAEALNPGFLQAMRTGLPFVRLKIASSLDGRTAMASGESKWITGPAARIDVQKIRARSAAIITGSGTVIADNPSLNVRSNELGVDVKQIPQPKVVVIDRRSRLSRTADYEVCRRSDTLFWREDDLRALLQTLVAEYQCFDVLVEAGAQLANGFLQARLVDELIVYQAPCLLGSTARPMMQFELANLSQQLRFQCVSHTLIGNDLKLVFTPL